MSTGFKGPIVHAPRSTQEGYKYRAGMGMMSSAEFCVIHEDFTDTITTTMRKVVPQRAWRVEKRCALATVSPSPDS